MSSTTTTIYTPIGYIGTRYTCIIVHRNQYLLLVLPISLLYHSPPLLRHIGKYKYVTLILDFIIATTSTTTAAFYISYIYIKPIPILEIPTER